MIMRIATYRRFMAKSFASAGFTPTHENGLTILQVEHGALSVALFLGVIVRSREEAHRDWIASVSVYARIHWRNGFSIPLTREFTALVAIHPVTTCLAIESLS